MKGFSARLSLFCVVLLLTIESASPELQQQREWSPGQTSALYRARNDIFPPLADESNGVDRRNGNRRVIECDDCGSRCISTRIAKPMRGECVGPTSAAFYTGREVPPGSPMWRVQYLPLRSCVGHEGQANIRQQGSVSALVQIDPFLFNLGITDVQDQCRRRWIDIRYPPTFFYTCNDPLAMEEAQIAFAGTAAAFREQHLTSLRASIALAVNNLKAIDSNMTVTADDVVVVNITDAAPCDPGTNTTAAAFCDKRLVSARDGIRARFRVVNQEATYADLDNVLYVTEAYGAELQRVLSLALEEFVEVQMTLGRDASLCEGPADGSSCLAGRVCGRVTERAAFTDFTSPAWWARADPRWFGGSIPSRPALREWYCDSDPRLFVGTVKVGQIGTADFYLRSSNPQVKSECDAGEGAGAAQCAGINRTTPVPGDCCGYCFLSNLHLVKLFNCSGMQHPLRNPELVATIADYCRRTQVSPPPTPLPRPPHPSPPAPLPTRSAEHRWSVRWRGCVCGGAAVQGDAAVRGGACGDGRPLRAPPRLLLRYLLRSAGQGVRGSLCRRPPCPRWRARLRVQVRVRLADPRHPGPHRLLLLGAPPAPRPARPPPLCCCPHRRPRGGSGVPGGVRVRAGRGVAGAAAAAGGGAGGEGAAEGAGQAPAPPRLRHKLRHSRPRTLTPHTVKPYTHPNPQP